MVPKDTKSACYSTEAATTTSLVDDDCDIYPTVFVVIVVVVELQNVTQVPPTKRPQQIHRE